MDKKSRQKLSRVYDKHLKEHGFSMRSLAPTIGAKYNKDHQEVKFQFVLDQLDETNSLLDVGCGLGHLAEYCRKGAWKGKYTGIDISGGMVKAASSRLKTDDFYQTDILEETYDRKHDVVVSIGTLQQKPPYENSNVYLELMIARMFEISTKCIVFDIFSTKFSDFKNPDNIYVDPSTFLDTLYKFTNRLIFFNHYNPYQLMIVMYKEKISGWNSERS
jgi:cyclopropane fatty-acyl-phospholipid synthase-like methyltransferase